MYTFNVLYPRLNARDDEVERLDDVMLTEGRVIIDHIHYQLKSLGPPEYTKGFGVDSCGAVTYRWLATSLGGAR
jgi:hypothetical protein